MGWWCQLYWIVQKDGQRQFQRPISMWRDRNRKRGGLERNADAETSRREEGVHQKDAATTTAKKVVQMGKKEKSCAGTKNIQELEVREKGEGTIARRGKGSHCTRVLPAQTIPFKRGGVGREGLVPYHGGHDLGPKETAIYGQTAADLSGLFL